ncbi:hypothetical protein CGRA01v4_09764 [Colletotrichum graminicola]|nr:hypothetical protein CGRA01v4_09764 [Colletotrichum graminicola]
MALGTLFFSYVPRERGVTCRCFASAWPKPTTDGLRPHPKPPTYITSLCVWLIRSLSLKWPPSWKLAILVGAPCMLPERHDFANLKP